MQRNKLTSERYPNTTLYLAKECLGFLSKHSEVDISCKNCDYKMQALEQPTSDDCVSRAEVIDELNRLGRNAFKDDTDYDNFFAFVDNLPPVTPTHGTCKDCKYCEDIGVKTTLYCKRYGINHLENYYCADFENGRC